MKSYSLVYGHKILKVGDICIVVDSGNKKDWNMK